VEAYDAHADDVAVLPGDDGRQGACRFDVAEQRFFDAEPFGETAKDPFDRIGSLAT